MDLAPIIPLIPNLIEMGKPVIEVIKPFIKGQGYNLPPDLEVRIKELEAKNNSSGIIESLKDFEKNCNNKTLTQTNQGQGAINLVGGNNTINQSFNSKEQENPDITLFKEIDADFPNEFVRFIKNHSFDRPFKDKDTDALSNLYHKYDNPKYQFINEDLKSKWNMLFGRLKKFADYLALNTFELKSGIQGVEPESEQRDEIIKMLDSLAGDVYNQYEDFVVNGKQILFQQSKMNHLKTEKNDEKPA